jgi:DNA-binding XRE family transcriptional regulator
MFQDETYKKCVKMKQNFKKGVDNVSKRYYYMCHSDTNGEGVIDTELENEKKMAVEKLGGIGGSAGAADEGGRGPGTAVGIADDGGRKPGMSGGKAGKAQDTRTELEKIRVRIGKSQEDVARAAGITRAAYTNIENGKRRPSPGVAQKIAKCLGFDWTLFFTKWDRKRKKRSA